MRSQTLLVHLGFHQIPTVTARDCFQTFPITPELCSVEKSTFKNEQDFILRNIQLPSLGHTRRPHASSENTELYVCLWIKTKLTRCLFQNTSGGWAMLQPVLCLRSIRADPGSVSWDWTLQSTTMRVRGRVKHSRLTMSSHPQQPWSDLYVNTVYSCTHIQNK